MILFSKSSVEVKAAQKFDKFMSNSLVGMKVEDVPGIGSISAKNMQRKGIDSATQIFRYFLALRGSSMNFKAGCSWFVEVPWMPGIVKLFSRQWLEN